MLLKRKVKKKSKILEYCYRHRFLRKFISRTGCIFFRSRYNLKPYFRKKISKYIKRFRFLSIFPYTFKHILK